MDCLEARNQIASLLDDLLEPREAERLRGHLAACTACAEEERRIERLFGLAKAYAAPEPSPLLWQRIRASLRKPAPLPWGQRVEAWLDRGREAAMRFLPGYAAGAASAALFLIVFFPASQSPEKDGALQPVREAGIVSSPARTVDGFPVRYFGVGPDRPGKRFVALQNGQLWEVEEPPARPAVDYPVREVGSLASRRFRDL